MGRATDAIVKVCKAMLISIHALRGEGDLVAARSDLTAAYISIHALRGEGDVHFVVIVKCKSYFNPRPPWGGRLSASRIQHISIIFQSTPSVGRATSKPKTPISAHGNFNPRPPWGGRLATYGYSLHISNFNPRPPWGGRRVHRLHQKRVHSISIHALRGEGDSR